MLDPLATDKYVVTFGAQHSIGWRFYPAWLQSLEEAFGPILSRLRADDLPNCMRDLKEGNVDGAMEVCKSTQGPTASVLYEGLKSGSFYFPTRCTANKCPHS